MAKELDKYKICGFFAAFFITLLLFICSSRAGFDLSGDGSRENPYLISSQQDLVELSKAVGGGEDFENKYFKQTRNIDLNNSVFASIGDVKAGNKFSGIYDGDCFYIDNLVVVGGEYSGLFQYCDGVVKNLGINSGRIFGEKAGGIVAYSVNRGAKIVNCYNRADIYAQNAGGIAYEFAGDILSCWSDCKFEVSGNAGGIVGENSRSITNSFTTYNCIALFNKFSGEALNNKIVNKEDVTSKDFISFTDKSFFYHDISNKKQYNSILNTKHNIPFNGDGSEEIPWQISSARDLITLGHLVNDGYSFENEHLVQTEDIDLTGIKWIPIGHFATGRYFKGSYDGNGRIISNLTTDENSVIGGLFGNFNGVIKNLGIEGGTISSDYSASFAVSSDNSDTAIINSYSNANVYGKYCGGLVYKFSGYILGCGFNGDIKGEEYGGIAGIKADYIVNSYSRISPFLALDKGKGTLKDCGQINDENIADISMKLNSLLQSTAYYGITKGFIDNVNELNTWQTDKLEHSESKYVLNANTFWNYLKSKINVILIGVLITALILVSIAFVCKRNIFGNFKNVLDKFNINKIYNAVALMVIIFSILSIIALFVIGKTPKTDIVKFIGFGIFYLFLPGYVFCRKEYFSGALLYSTAILVSAFILIVSFLIGSAINNMVTVYVVPLIFSCISLYHLFTNINNKGISRFKLDLGLCAVICVFTFFSFLKLGVTGVSPINAGYVNGYADSLWIAGNSAALTGGLPATIFDIAGRSYRYHMVSSVLQACAAIVTKISSVNVFFTYWSFVFVPLCILSFFAFASLFFENDKKTLKCIITVLLTSYFSIELLYVFNNVLYKNVESIGIIGVFRNLFAFPNGIEIAIPAIVICTVIIIGIYKNTFNTKTAYVMVFAFSFIMTGAKGPFGAMMASVLFAVLIIELFRKRKIDYKNICIFSACAIAALAGYFIFIYGKNTIDVEYYAKDIVKYGRYSLNDIGLNEFSGGAPTIFSFKDSRSVLTVITIWKHVVNYLSSIGFEISENAAFAIKVMVIPVSVICINPFAIPGFIADAFNNIKNFKKIGRDTILIFGIALCGLAVLFLFQADGNSQYYFLFGAIFFIQIIGYAFVSKGFCSFKTGWKVFYIVMLFLSLFTSVKTYSEIGMQSVGRWRSIYRYSGSVPEPSYNTLTAYEYEGLKWIKDNTDKNALLAVDRHYASKVDEGHVPTPNDNARYYYYGAFANRHLYIGSWAYTSRTEEMQTQILGMMSVNKRLYEDNVQERIQLMKENNISYIVCSRFVNESMTINDQRLEVVFKNRDMTVYGIKNNYNNDDKNNMEY